MNEITLYEITPIEKKSVLNRIELFRTNEDGSASWFTIEDHYRWGKGYIDEEEFLPDPDNEAYCCSEIGPCSELDDLVASSIEYSEDISPEERKEIEHNYYEGGTSWIYDGDHEWQIEDDAIIISPPYNINKIKPI